MSALSYEPRPRKSAKSASKIFVASTRHRGNWKRAKMITSQQPITELRMFATGYLRICAREIFLLNSEPEKKKTEQNIYYYILLTENTLSVINTNHRVLIYVYKKLNLHEA
jgi:hypothetical protein